MQIQRSSLRLILRGFLKVCYSFRVENSSFDVVVIGGGPGGCEAARVLAGEGKRVALVEGHKVGGECLHYGCIPSKVFLHSSEVYAQMQKAAMFGVVIDGGGGGGGGRGESDGVAGGVRLDWKIMQERCAKVVSMLHRGLEGSLQRAGVTVISGVGRLVEPHRVEVRASDGSVASLQAEHVILASGSRAKLTGGVMIGGRVITNREIFSLPEKPESIVIVGGGTIGCEMASFFATIGTKVTLIEYGSRVLMREDEEISAEFVKLLTRLDVAVLCDTAVDGVDNGDDGVRVKVREVGAGDDESGGDGRAASGASGVTGEEKIIEASYALIATGRELNLDVADIAGIGVECDIKGVTTNKNMQTNLPHVYAIGDVAGKSLLAYSAEREGEIAAHHILGANIDGTYLEIDYASVPSVIFTHPEIASVGMSEARARMEGKDVIVKKALFAAHSKALIIGQRDGFVKVVVERGSLRVLGVHIIGPDATVMINKATLAVDQGLTVSAMLRAMAGHPVTEETMEEAFEMVVEEK